MSKILIVRHGLTEFNSNRKFCGITDIDMSPEGYRQIEKARDRLAKQKIDTVFCSDLKRARVSAEIITAGRNLEIRTAPELREMNYGRCETMTWDEISKDFPDITENMIHRSLNLGFPEGESLNDLASRISRFAGVLKQYPPEQTVLVVGHSGPLGVLICTLLEFGIEAFWRFYIDNASLSIVNTYPDFAILNLLNDISHLDGLKELK
ncbi:MAG: histidine phosphatase family protein [Dehalococcoidales bacterium]|nr:histidine phosphatase family protein [Dehalococcoidales bacterium]